MYKITFKESYLKQKKKRHMVSQAVNVTDTVLSAVESLPGRSGKSAKLLRELLHIMAGH